MQKATIETFWIYHGIWGFRIIVMREKEIVEKRRLVGFKSRSDAVNDAASLCRVLKLEPIPVAQLLGVNGG